MTEKETTAINNIEDAIKNIQDNKFNIFFFTIDSKNVPNGTISYIYQMAKTLKDFGYNVTMLYQLENEYSKAELHKLKKKEALIDDRRVFTGVGEWLGQEYADLPHMNIATEQWRVSPSDFLFIPEVFASLMQQTFKYKAPCKRYVILQNFNYVSEFIPFGLEWKNFGIYDAIATTEKQATLIKSVFPYVRTKVINPYIPEYFREPVEAKKLVVNIISKKKDDINRIIKPFYWKYPVYKFVSFQDLRNYPREQFADLLKEGAVTIWLDSETPFGYSALEAMRCGNIVIGKVPDVIPEWMENNGVIKDNGLWTYDINQIPDMIANVVSRWLQDDIPSEITDAMKETNSEYTYETWLTSVNQTFNDLIEEHVNSLKEIKGTLLNKANNQEEAE